MLKMQGRELNMPNFGHILSFLSSLAYESINEYSTLNHKYHSILKHKYQQQMNNLLIFTRIYLTFNYFTATYRKLCTGFTWYFSCDL